MLAWDKVMAGYRRVYGFGHLLVHCPRTRISSEHRAWFEYGSSFAFYLTNVITPNLWWAHVSQCRAVTHSMTTIYSQEFPLNLRALCKTVALCISKCRKLANTPSPLKTLPLQEKIFHSHKQSSCHQISQLYFKVQTVFTSRADMSKWWQWDTRSSRITYAECRHNTINASTITEPKPLISSGLHQYVYKLQ